MRSTLQPHDNCTIEQSDFKFSRLIKKKWKIYLYIVCLFGWVIFFVYLNDHAIHIVTFFNIYWTDCISKMRFFPWIDSPNITTLNIGTYHLKEALLLTNGKFSALSYLRLVLNYEDPRIPNCCCKNIRRGRGRDGANYSGCKINWYTGMFKY